MKLALLGTAGILLAFQANDPTPGPGPFENMGQVWIALIVLIGNAMQAYITLGRDKLALQREERQRQWLIEDRRHNEELSDRTRQEILTEQGRVERKLDENTTISRDAAAASKAAETAANNVNEKIAEVGAMRRSDAHSHSHPDRRTDDTGKT